MIGWIVGIGLSIIGVGVAAAFLDELAAWAEQVIGHILDELNKLVEQALGACAYIIKQGRRYYKRVEVFSRNLLNGKLGMKPGPTVEISEEELPAHLREEVDTKEKVEVITKKF